MTNRVIGTLSVFIGANQVRVRIGPKFVSSTLFTNEPHRIAAGMEMEKNFTAIKRTLNLERFANLLLRRR